MIFYYSKFSKKGKGALSIGQSYSPQREIQTWCLNFIARRMSAVARRDGTVDCLTSRTSWQTFRFVPSVVLSGPFLRSLRLMASQPFFSWEPPWSAGGRIVNSRLGWLSPRLEFQLGRCADHFTTMSGEGQPASRDSLGHVPEDRSLLTKSGESLTDEVVDDPTFVSGQGDDTRLLLLGRLFHLSHQRLKVRRQVTLHHLAVFGKRRLLGHLSLRSGEPPGYPFPPVHFLHLLSFFWLLIGLLLSYSSALTERIRLFTSLPQPCIINVLSKGIIAYWYNLSRVSDVFLAIQKLSRNIHSQIQFIHLTGLFGLLYWN